MVEYSDEEIQQIKDTQDNQTKLNFVIDRLVALENKVENNGLQRDVILNSWFRRLSLTIFAGLIIWWFTAI